GSPWQRLNLRPDPHGHGALRGTSPKSMSGLGSAGTPVVVVVDPATGGGVAVAVPPPDPLVRPADDVGAADAARPWTPARRRAARFPALWAPPTRSTLRCTRAAPSALGAEYSSCCGRLASTRPLATIAGTASSSLSASSL